MVLAWVRFAVTAAAILTGLAAFTGAVIGNWRFGFILNRIHAGGIGDTMAILFVVLGIAVSSLKVMDILKLVILVLFLWSTSPVTSHFLAQLEVLTNPRVDKEVTCREDVLGAMAQKAINAGDDKGCK